MKRFALLHPPLSFEPPAPPPCGIRFRSQPRRGQRMTRSLVSSSADGLRVVRGKAPPPSPFYISRPMEIASRRYVPRIAPRPPLSSLSDSFVLCSPPPFAHEG